MGANRPIEIFTSLEHKRGVARVLEGLACGAFKKGEARLRPAEQSKLDQMLQCAWQSLGEPEGKSAWLEGSNMKLETAIHEALEDLGSATAAVPGQ